MNTETNTLRKEEILKEFKDQIFNKVYKLEQTILELHAFNSMLVILLEIKPGEAAYLYDIHFVDGLTHLNENLLNNHLSMCKEMFDSFQAKNWEHAVLL
jgi:uncharacterized protein involved in tolerance to divalent cations